MQARYARNDLIDLLPQNPPFLFLDSASADLNRAEATYRITGDEAPGHFVGNPVFPAALMIEALGQLACVWLLAHVEREHGAEARKRTRLFFAGLERVRARRICTPGDVLSLVVEIEKLRVPLAYFRGTIQVGDERTASCESLMLSFGEQD